MISEDARHLVLLSGLGGIGKSTTCAHWFNSTAINHFDNVAWVSCKDGIANGLVESQIYQKLSIDDDPHKLLDAISQLSSSLLSGKTLFVLDDIREPKDDLLRRFRNVGHASFSLITTSRLKLQGFKEQIIGMLSPEHCLELFTQFYDIDRETDDIALVEQLIKKAGRHTLTIELIAKTMTANGLNLKAMLQALTEKGFDLSHTLPESADFTKDGEEYSAVLNDALRSLFDIAQLAEKHQFILFLLGHFNGASFAKTSVKDWFLLGGLTELNELEKSGWLTKEKGLFYHLHPVISDVARRIFDTESEKITLESLLPDEVMSAFLNQIVSSLSDENFNSQYPGDFHLLQPLRQFYSYIENESGNESENKAETFALALGYTANRLKEQSNYQQALPLCNRALGIRKKTLGSAHPQVAASLNNLAALYRELGDYEQALPLYNRALGILEKALGPAHPQVATSLNNLAELYRAIGDYEQALPLYNRALSILENALVPYHSTVGTTLNNLAELYRAMGDYQQALPLHKQALGIREKSLGPDHPDVGTSLNNLAGLYESMGDYEQALPLCNRALGIWEKALGPEHPDVATSLNNLANLHKAMSDYQQALPLYNRALCIQEKALGPEHPNVATSLNNLASLYKAMGDYEQALILYNQALDIMEKALGPEHPDVAPSLNNMAELYKVMGDYEPALPLYVRCLELWNFKLGKAHPNTKTGATNFLMCVQVFTEKLQSGELDKDNLSADFDMQSLVPTVKLAFEILQDELTEGAVALEE